MHTTYIWHQFNIHWRKIGFLLLILALQYPVFSQTKVYNRRFLENYDDKDIHFGFYFGTGFSRLDPKHSDYFLNQTDETVLVSSPPKFAFKVGMVVNKYLNNRWDIRTTPGINISSKQVDYEIFGKPTISDSRDLDYFELPVLFKYKSERRKNSRMYMVAGGNFLVETNIRKGQSSLISKLPTKTADFCIEYGFGYEQFLEFGKFTGEVRFSHGIKNLYVADVTKPYSKGIEALKSHTVTVYLYFE
ncbi:MAG: porin family protein [Bacteroidota bacterium]